MFGIIHGLIIGTLSGGSAIKNKYEDEKERKLRELEGKYYYIDNKGNFRLVENNEKIYFHTLSPDHRWVDMTESGRILKDYEKEEENDKLRWIENIRNDYKKRNYEAKEKAIDRKCTHYYGYDYEKEIDVNDYKNRNILLVSDEFKYHVVRRVIDDEIIICDSIDSSTPIEIKNKEWRIKSFNDIELIILDGCNYKTLEYYLELNSNIFNESSFLTKSLYSNFLFKFRSELKKSNFNPTLEEFEDWILKEYRRLMEL